MEGAVIWNFRACCLSPAVAPKTQRSERHIIQDPGKKHIEPSKALAICQNNYFLNKSSLTEDDRELAI